MSLRHAVKRPRFWIWTLLALLAVLTSIKAVNVARRANALHQLHTQRLSSGNGSETERFLRTWSFPDSWCTRIGEVMIASGHVDTMTIYCLESTSSLSADLSCIRFFPELTHLELKGERFDNRSLEVLRFLPNLKSFYYFHSDLDGPVNDEGLQHLRHCGQLTCIGLSGAQTSASFLEVLPHPELITEFSIALSGYFDDDALLQLARCPNLECVNLSHAIRYTGEGLVVFEKLKKVETLAVHLRDEKYLKHVAQIPNLSVRGLKKKKPTNLKTAAP